MGTMLFTIIMAMLFVYSTFFPSITYNAQIGINLLQCNVRGGEWMTNVQQCMKQFDGFSDEELLKLNDDTCFMPLEYVCILP